MAGFVAFQWKGGDYYYSPSHHKIFSRPDTDIPPPEDHVGPPSGIHIRNLYLNLSAGCNLRCEYCFTPADAPSSDVNMGPEVIRAAIMKLGHWWASQPTRASATITFFGGEPLLNREGLQYAVYFAEEWKRSFGIPFSFSISTNGTLVTEADIRFFRDHDIFVWFSIDGPPEIHDRRRRFRSGNASSHRLAIEHAAWALRMLPPPRVGVRATLSEGAGKLSEIVNYLGLQGFKVISTSGVEPNQIEQCSLDEQDLQCLAEGLDDCADVLLRWRKCGVRSFPLELDLLSLDRGTSSGRFICDAGRGSLTVDPQGGLFPCHRFVGQQNYALGSVTGEINLAPCEQFAGLDYAAIPGCKDCWARKFCLGSCVGASAAAGLPLGHPYAQHCKERKLYALISLKCAVEEGHGLLT